ncbi:MAG: protein kinase, partial [Deltaproteobacteria bacterium]|nr:protein kinase [Deltaproteobacteria bacterium]
QVTLTDFGLVRSLENSAQLTQSGATLGTPAYMAPEQADPERWGEITHLTDVYALGIILYQMLLGRPPFEGETAALLYAHVNTEPAVPLEMISTLGDDLVAVLLKALAKAPAERYASAGALVAALQTLVEQRDQAQAHQTELQDLLARAKTARQKEDWPLVTQLCSQIIRL